MQLTPHEIDEFVDGNSTLKQLIQDGIATGEIKQKDLEVFVHNLRVTGDAVLKKLTHRREELRDSNFSFPAYVREFATIVRGVESNLRRGPAEDPEELDKETLNMLREQERDRGRL